MIRVVQEISARIKSALLHQEDVELDASTASKTGAITLGARAVTGDSPNIVSPRCTVTVDQRLAPRESVQKVLDESTRELQYIKTAQKPLSET